MTPLGERFPGSPRAPVALPLDGGFSLLEVLIALVILSVGLLGLAVLQAEGLRGTSSAFQRNQAVQLVSDIADRMRANRAGLAGYLLPAQDLACADRESGGSVVTANDCTPQQMAQHDLFEWTTNLSAGGYTGTIVAVGGTTNQFVITVQWTDRTVATPQQHQTTIQL